MVSAAMTPFEKVLTLRPAHVVQRLGPASRLPLLNAADLLRALPGDGALPMVPLVATRAMAGILRAAREQSAVVGISIPVGPARGSTVKTVEWALALAEEERHRLPFFLQGGPFVASGADARELAQLGRAVFDLVDAGCTLISLDASALLEDSAPAVVAELLRPALERELAVELVAPSDPSHVRAWLDGLTAAGVHPAFARCPSGAFVTPGGVDFEAVERWAKALASGSVAPSIELRGRLHRRSASAWVAAGVRKLEAGDELAEGALTRLPQAMREEIVVGAQREATWRLLAAARDAIDALDAGQQERMEALIFGEALELFGACHVEGAAKAMIQRLSDQGPA